MKDVKVEELISLMFMSGRLIHKQTAGRAKADPRSISQMTILSLISEGGSPTMKDIADSLCITSPSATTAINHLVKAGQLKRVPDKDDRRVIRLEITAKGREIVKKIKKDVVAQISEVLEKLNTQERNAFAGIFRKIINAYQDKR